MSQFVDDVSIRFQSGKGGKGSSSFHREKHVPRGGPNGSDGGRGGDIVLIADKGVRTLYAYMLCDHYEAEDGTDAHGNKHGRDAKNLELRVPIGTIVSVGGEVVADLDSDGSTHIVVRGGRGGRGNLHFTNSVRQSPTMAELGGPSEVVEAKLELRLLADVGIVGLPNAGKSTLISACSAAKPKIAAYPFTTITPNLGVVSLGDKTFTLADMPGLIEGASQGVGLGHQFLRHIKRTRVLIHLVDLFPLDGSDPIQNYEIVERELREFADDLGRLPKVIALNKADLAPTTLSPGPVDGKSTPPEVAPFLGRDADVFVVSGVTGAGIQPLLYRVKELLDISDSVPIPIVLRPLPTEKQTETWDVAGSPEGFVVTGKGVERAVQMTDLGNNEAVRYLYRKFVRMGIIDRLRELGAEDGDQVVIGDFVFSYLEGG
ncbi:MAG: GTPase ObgE [Chthonomonadaceae bacterium]|nr:GTPase ObgE [Chthonomonadaceae bacterium]